MTDPDGKGDDTTGYAYSHMTGHGDTTITIRPRGIMVCYRIGKAISITTMNYSVAIFVYSRMIRYPDNAITELRYSRISK